jgi:hypothetical protein
MYSQLEHQSSQIRSIMKYCIFFTMNKILLELETSHKGIPSLHSSWWLTLILSPYLHLGLPSVPFLTTFLTKILLHVSYHSHMNYIGHPSNIWWSEQTPVLISPPSCYFPIFTSALHPQILWIYVLPSERIQFSHHSEQKMQQKNVYQIHNIKGKGTSKYECESRGLKKEDQKTRSSTYSISINFNRFKA